jgi:opacity protein-like surface antigen
MKHTSKLFILSSYFILALLAFSNTAAAQKDQIEKITKFIKKKRINAGYVMFGISRLNLIQLNSFLESSDLPEVDEFFFSYGLGGHVIHNKFVVGLEIVRTFEKYNQETDGFRTSTKSKYGVLNFGYLLRSKKGLMHYPYLGVGIGKLTLRVTENNIKSFNDITGYQRGSESSATNFLFNLGFAVDYFYKFNEKKKGQNNLVIGIRIGWIFSPVRRDWQVNHTRVVDGPDSGISGPYLRFTVGLGGWIEKLIKKAI